MGYFTETEALRRIDKVKRAITTGIPMDGLPAVPGVEGEEGVYLRLPNGDTVLVTIRSLP